MTDQNTSMQVATTIEDIDVDSNPSILQADASNEPPSAADEQLQQDSHTIKRPAVTLSINSDNQLYSTILWQGDASVTMDLPLQCQKEIELAWQRMMNSQGMTIQSLASQYLGTVAAGSNGMYMNDNHDDTQQLADDHDLSMAGSSSDMLQPQVASLNSDHVTSASVTVPTVSLQQCLDLTSCHRKKYSHYFKGSLKFYRDHADSLISLLRVLQEAAAQRFNVEEETDPVDPEEVIDLIDNLHSSKDIFKDGADVFNRTIRSDHINAKDQCFEFFNLLVRSVTIWLVFSVSGGQLKSFVSLMFDAICATNTPNIKSVSNVSSQLKLGEFFVTRFPELKQRGAFHDLCQKLGKWPAAYLGLSFDLWYNLVSGDKAALVMDQVNSSYYEILKSVSQKFPKILESERSCHSMRVSSSSMSSRHFNQRR